MGIITVNKYIRLINISAVFGLASFISLAHANDALSNNNHLHLASSLAIHSYEGECCANGRACCTPYQKVSYGRVNFKHHHKKHHRKQHHKHHHKHYYKYKSSCGCQYG